MATGIVGTVATSGTITYTATSNAKMLISTYSQVNGTVQIGNAIVCGSATAGITSSAKVYVAAGATLSIHATNCDMVVSVLEQYS